MATYEAPSTLPLPRRIWRPWTEQAALVGFSCAFHLDQAAQATLYLSASGPCRLWVDGDPLDLPEGPLPSWRSMIRRAVVLAVGEHRLYIECQGVDAGQPFLMACLDWESDGQPRRVETSARWLAWANPTPGEVPPADGAGWAPAWAFDGVWSEPWGFPCNAPDDFCRMTTGWQRARREPLARLAEVYHGLVPAGAWARVLEGNALAFQPVPLYPAAPPKIDYPRPRLEWYRSREAHSIINNQWLDLFAVRAPHLTLDAGAETFARLHVRLRGGGPAIFALTTGESLPEVQRYNRRVTDVFELQSGETFVTAPTGFRYARLTCLSSAPGEPAVVEPLTVEHIEYPLEHPGRFACSDPALNAIWDLSFRTLHLCMQTEIWDGIKRDQLPWMGDLYTEALAAYQLFGDFRLARRSLRVLGEIGPTPDRPLTRQAYPGLTAVWKIPGGDMNSIPSYTLWWLVGMSDYYRYSGDRTLVEELAPELEATLAHVLSWIDADGRWRLRGGWDFIDWSPAPAAEREAYCHLLAYRVLGLGAELLEVLGRSGADCRAAQARMARAARLAWWVDGRAGFGAAHHANAQAIRSGIFTPTEAEAVFEQTLAADPPGGMTYWHRYLDLEAAAQVGRVDWGLAAIRRHWGQALQVGMTALWEAFDPAWIGPDPHGVSMVGAEYARYGGYETSLCHGWSAGPALWLNTSVLGVQPGEPGFTRLKFTPNLGDLEWAEGEIPTRLGRVQVRLDRAPDGAQRAMLLLPDAMELDIPDEVLASWEIQIA